MPNEKGSDNIINSQTFGFFSAAAIEEAVRQANHDSNINSNDSNEKDEDDEQKPPSGDDGGKDDDSDGT